MSDPVVNSSDKMVTAGYSPSPAAHVAGAVASVQVNGSSILVAGATWAAQTPSGGGTAIVPTMLVGSATVFAGGLAVLLSTGTVTPAGTVLQLAVSPVRTVRAT